MSATAAVSHATDNRANLAWLVDHLREIESRMNPDIVTSLSGVRLTAADHVKVTGLSGDHALTEWSRAQLAKLVGLASWERWFAGANENERAEEMNRRLARHAGRVRIRTAKPQTDTSAFAGTVRAIVSTEYSPVSDVALAETIQGALHGVEDDVRLLRTSVTELSTTFVVALGKPFGAGSKEVGLVHGALLVRNSQVGFSRLVANLHLVRLVCSNGMTCPSAAPLVRAVHRHVDLGRVRERLLSGLGDIPAKLHRGVRVLEESLKDRVENVEDHVRDALREARLPLKLVAAVMAAYAREPHASRFGVVQALTLAAQSESPEVRDTLERAATRYVEARP